MYVSGLVQRWWTPVASESSICKDYRQVLLEGREMLSCLTWGFKLWKLSWDLKDCSLYTVHLGCFAAFAVSWPVFSARWILVNIFCYWPAPSMRIGINCSFFSGMVLNGYEITFFFFLFFHLFPVTWQASLVHAIFLLLRICLLKCCFGLNSQCFIIL